MASVPEVEATHGHRRLTAKADDATAHGVAGGISAYAGFVASVQPPSKQPMWAIYSPQIMRRIRWLISAHPAEISSLVKNRTKAQLRKRPAKTPMNARQIGALNRLLDGSEGKLTTSKWTRLAKCSQDTAYRDILDLVERGVLRKDAGGGRSSGYSVVGLDKGVR